MANRFPLIFNSGAGQIQELAASDNLDLTSSNLVNAGILFTSSGSATAPSLQIGSGTTYNPGLYSPGADQLSISTNGTGRLFVDSAGKIGIGAASVAGLLQIKYATDVHTSFRNATAGGLSAGTLIESVNDAFNSYNPIYLKGSQFIFGTDSAGSFVERLRITSAGVVNVKTTGGSDLFYVDDNTSKFYFSPNGSGEGIIKLDTANAIRFLNAGGERLRLTSTGALNFVGAGTAGSTQAVSFNGSAPVNSLVIDSSGRLGIGTSLPQAELSVAKTGGASTVYIESDAGNNATTSILRFGGASGRSASIQGFRGASSNIHSLDFYTYNSADAFGMRLTSTGLGIGTTPGEVLDVSAATAVARLTSSTGTNRCHSTFVNTGGTAYVGLEGSAGGVLSVGTAPYALTMAHAGAYPINFATNNLLRATIDSSGRLLVGTSSARSLFFAGGASALAQIEGNSTGTASLSITRNDATADGNALILAKARSTSYGILQYVNGTTSDDRIGRISFQGADGTNMVPAASIEAWTDATPGANDMPGRLVFSTTADGAASPTERMRIDNQGGVFINRTTGAIITSNERLTVVGAATIQRSSGTPLHVDRTTNDGNLVEFYQDTTIEGSISVSGNTVSLNGAHLSRWSQLPGSIGRIEILRGSVLSNIDEMCEWTDEENEQLNRMKVSDVEGDKNVSGVFQCWDDDDDTYTNDFYCAMTGDFIIRIAEGITVERGDLLMSAGDGTAKPQDDDIIRSKTVAKVTSTNVSCTYEDGSYCVPCVLMAC